MAPKYKLTYFDITGLGEPIRLLFHYGGIDFIDNRIDTDDWLPIKSSIEPLNQLPLLEFDGKKLHQSLAIIRYVAKQVGLAGDNDLEAYEIDAVADTINDLRLDMAPYYFEKDPERKANLKERLDNEKIPFILSKLDSWAKNNKGFLANGKLSWADIYLFALISYLKNYMGRDLFDGYPNLIAVKEHVLAIPRIKAWVDKRPPDVIKF